MGTGKEKVLVVVRHPVGGVRTHILYTYPLLMQAGYRFTFVVPKHEAYATFRNDLRSWDETEVVDAPYSDGSSGRPRFRRITRTLLRTGQFSLMHSHGLNVAIPAFFANLGIGVPHVVTSQDVFCHLKLPGVVGRLKLYALEQIIRRADVLIAVSEDTKSDHLQYLPGLAKGPCRVAVIPNGIDMDAHDLKDGDSPEILRRRVGINQEVFLIGFLGRFMPQKGFLLLAEALAAVARQPTARSFHLLAVGSDDYVREYRAAVEGRPELNGRVTFLEHVPKAGPILKILDLLVIPSLWEACPILPMEAMALGIPVLGSDCIGLREVLRNTPSVMVPTNDVPSLTRSLCEAIRQPWKAKAVEYAANARRRFDSRPPASQLKCLFDTLVGQRGDVPIRKELS